MALNLPLRIKIVNASPNIDELYGVYNNKTEAFNAVTNLSSTGLTVGVIEAGKLVEYWFEEDKPNTTHTIDDLVLKNPPLQGDDISDAPNDSELYLRTHGGWSIFNPDDFSPLFTATVRPAQTVGGFKSTEDATTAQGLTLDNAFKKLLFPPVDPVINSFSATVSSSREYLQSSYTVNVNFSYTIADPVAEISSLTIEKSVGNTSSYTQIYSITDFSGDAVTSITDERLNLSYSESKETVYYRITVTDSVGSSKSSTTSYSPISYKNTTLSFDLVGDGSTTMPDSGGRYEIGTPIRFENLKFNARVDNVEVKEYRIYKDNTLLETFNDAAYDNVTNNIVEGITDTSRVFNVSPTTKSLEIEVECDTVDIFNGAEVADSSVTRSYSRTVNFAPKFYYAFISDGKDGSTNWINTSTKQLVLDDATFIDKFFDTGSSLEIDKFEGVDINQSSFIESLSHATTVDSVYLLVLLPVGFHNSDFSIASDLDLIAGGIPSIQTTYSFTASDGTSTIELADNSGDPANTLPYKLAGYTNDVGYPNDPNMTTFLELIRQ